MRLPVLARYWYKYSNIVLKRAYVFKIFLKFRDSRYLEYQKALNFLLSSCSSSDGFLKKVRNVKKKRCMYKYVHSSIMLKTDNSEII